LVCHSYCISLVIGILIINSTSDVARDMDTSLSEVEESLRPHIAQFGQRKDNSAPGTIFDTLDSERFAERKNV
jgi:hypothetical protein